MLLAPLASVAPATYAYSVEKPTDDEVASRLRRLRLDLERTLGNAAVVEVQADEQGESVALAPVRERALGVVWTDCGSELQVETVGELGGRWELPRDQESVAFLEEVVRAAVDGRVSEVSAGDRSLVEVTLSDGSVIAEVGSVGLRSLRPKPGWKRSGERTQYQPYLT